MCGTNNNKHKLVELIQSVNWISKPRVIRIFTYVVYLVNILSYISPDYDVTIRTSRICPKNEFEMITHSIFHFYKVLHSRF